jgi:hypothetical protein
MSYDTAVKKSGRPTHFVFRGQTDDGKGTITPVVWATRALAEAGGMREPRLRADFEINRAMPQRLGDRPARCSVGLQIDNTDQSLRALLIGTTSSNPKDEYTQGSVLNLSGQLFHAVVDEDGTTYEAAVTPTLQVAGDPVYRDGIVSLPMASDDDKILGRSRFAWQLREINTSRRGTDGADPDHGAEVNGTWVQSNGTSGTLTQTDADSDFAEWQEALETPARFIYSSAQALPLIRVRSNPGIATTPGGGIRWANAISFFCFLTMLEPYVEGFSRWLFSVGNASDSQFPETLGGHRIHKIPRWVQDSEGAWKKVWVVYLKQSFVAKATNDKRQYQDQELWLSGLPPALGVADYPHAGPPPPRTDEGTPARVIRRMVLDHARATSPIDTASFDAAEAAIPFRDICGGFYEGTTPLAEVFTHIASAFGLTLWVGTDDKLHVMATGGFTPQDVATINAGGLDELTASDVMGEWQELTPRTAGRRGAAVSRVTVDWTDQQSRFWGKDRLLRMIRASSRIPLSQIVEARVSGAWLNPDPARTLHALQRYAAACSYTTRRIQFRTRAWIAARELGTFMYLTHRRGLETTAGGYARRLVRLEAVQLDAARRTALVTFEDLGPVSHLRFALLDDYANWIRGTPAAGNTLTLTAGSTAVACSAAFFAPGDVGKTLVLRGSGIPGNRRNRKIVAFTNTTHVTVDFAMASNESIVAAGSGVDAKWLVAHNHGSPPGAGRELVYIQVGREDTGHFTDGSDAFSYEAA